MSLVSLLQGNSNGTTEAELSRMMLVSTAIHQGHSDTDIHLTMVVV